MRLQIFSDLQPEAAMTPVAVVTPDTDATVVAGTPLQNRRERPTRLRTPARVVEVKA